MVKKTILMLALFLLLVIPLSSLVKADFTIESQLETNTVCPSNTIIINEIITSTSDSSYSVSVSGSAAQFTTAVPSGFFLSAGQNQSVFLYITPSSRINPGSYNLDVQITSQGNTKTVSHSVIVENCHRTTISVEPITQKSCSCEEKSIKLTIFNSGNYLENYHLSAEGPLASYVTLSSSSFSLASNQSINVIAYVKTPCNVFGDYGINFMVNADSKYAQTEAVSQMQLIPCYDYTLASEKNFYDLCENQKISIPINITNIGTVENTYDIKTTGPDWVVSDQKSLKISPNQEKTFNLITQPPLKTQGNFSSTLDVLSEKGAIDKKISLDFKVDSCYGSSVSLENTKDQICNSFENTYNVSVKNTGKFKNTFNIILEAPAWVKIDKTQVTLDAGEQTGLILEAAPPADTKPSTYSIIVQMQDPLNNITNQDILSLTTISQEDCYKPSVSSEKDEISVPQDTPATLLFTIENKGLITADYVIELSGTADSFSKINPSAITLEPNKAQTLYLYLFPSVDTPVGNYTLTLTSRLKDSTISSEKTIQVNVLKASEQSIINITNKTNQTNINQTQGKPKESFWQKLTGFFISIFTPKKTTESPTNHPPQLIKNIPNIEINSGEQFKINLSQYFKDKDVNDTLEYIAVKPEDLNLLIKGSVMTIIAPQGFEGSRDIIFYATDGKKMVPSNLVKIIVTRPVVITNTANQTNQAQPIINTTNETNQTNQSEQINCNVYYWFDNNNKNCTYKEFCGTYMYQGLQTFETSNDCKKAVSDLLAKQAQLAANTTNVTNQTLLTNVTNQTNTNTTTNKTNQSNQTNNPITTEIKPLKNTTNQTNLVNITGQTTEKTNTGNTSNKSVISTFLTQYRSYLILAVLAAIVIIIIMSGLGKKILEFFEEEEPKKK